jgi:hypothetical protein
LSPQAISSFGYFQTISDSFAPIHSITFAIHFASINLMLTIL